jgi:hypothetical protein
MDTWHSGGGHHIKNNNNNKNPELFRKDHLLIIHVITSPVFENRYLAISS